MKKKMIVAIIITSMSLSLYADGLKKLTDNWFLVVGDKINVREKPDVKSKVLVQLPITHEVILLKRSGLLYQNNDIKGEWVYIDTQLGNINNLKAGTYKGWMVDFFLSDRSEFKKMDSFADCVMEGYVGDFPLSYRFRKDGTYTRLGYLPNPNTPDGSKGKTFNCEGKLYRYRDVVIAQDEKSETEDAWLIINTLYFREDGKLCSTHGDGNGNQLCTKDK